MSTDIEKLKCEPGYFLPEDGKKCQKCSVENCNICQGTKLSDICLSCNSYLTPIYEEDKINININRNNVPLSDKMKKVYGIYFPQKEHLNLEPPRIPQSYILPIDIYNYVNIGNKNFIYDKMKNNLIKMNYKIAKNPPHIYLNHFFNNCFESENYITSNINFRVRSKFTCLIYYNPKKNFCIKKNE